MDHNEKNQPIYHEPYNDAIDHLSKVEGYPSGSIEVKKLPKGIKILWYIIIGGMIGLILFIVLGTVLK
ncbi:hypothetical protein [Fredinandcohnia quinoae]|uniref:Uncharacterized protein n=1 Tax=Fredinandcohnia quinoae TaxID=2918902 RepID=A0AAW5E9Y7_9BACI|nr:hypothetical protein [Fredinandcohnia sp. SECRCQ15]MCH1626817.1 hypothetical protein [Fredinandcohnia sp. SECRCQ15]